MSDPVGNPEDRFSRVEAHIVVYVSSVLKYGEPFCPWFEQR